MVGILNPFKKATSWELKFGKVASMVFSLLFGYLLLSHFKFLIDFDGAFETLRHKLRVISFCFNFLFYSSIVLAWVLFRNDHRDRVYYPFALLISVIAINVSIFIDMHHPLITYFFSNYAEGINIAGRHLYYQMVPFPIIIVFALFHLRVWAVFLFFALAVSPIVYRISLIINHPETFFVHLPKLVGDVYELDRTFWEFSLTICIMAITSAFGLLYFFKYALSAVQKTEQKNFLLGRYFSPDVRDEIEATNTDLQSQGPKELKVAIIFTDIVGFTKLSEKMRPKDVMQMLSEYQAIMVEAIFENKGTVDKFIGDAVMANFGTPKSHGNDAQNAFNCAVSMNLKLDEWNKERGTKNLPQIQHRIGIHFGTCVVGNIGGEQRIEFAVIGDAVNVASRICDACKEFDTNFLITYSVANRIKHKFKFENVLEYYIRGRDEPIGLVKIYSEKFKI